MDLKAEKLATEAKNFEKQQKEIAKLEDFVNRNIVRASTLSVLKPVANS